eukprot:SAG25_NODE_1379_length_3164_cov_2.328222_3_plen_103_part_00
MRALDFGGDHTVAMAVTGAGGGVTVTGVSPPRSRRAPGADPSVQYAERPAGGGPLWMGHSHTAELGEFHRPWRLSEAERVKEARALRSLGGPSDADVLRCVR